MKTKKTNKADTPALDRKKAKRVPQPYRHEPTARTVAWEQEDGGDKHLFSATRQYIATEKAKPAAAPPVAAKQEEPKPEKPTR